MKQKNIVIEKLKPKIFHVVYVNDTLPPKEKIKKKNLFAKFDEKKDVTKDNTKNHPLAVIGLILGIITFASTIWMILGLTIISLFGYYVFYLIGISMLSSLTGMILSFLAIIKIYNNPDKYDGIALAKFGFALSLFYWLFILFISIF